MNEPFDDIEDDSDMTDIPVNNGLCEICGELVYDPNSKICAGCKEEEG